MLERIRLLREEVSAIQEANKRYLSRDRHSAEDVADHTQRRRRLEEIVGELRTLALGGN